MGTSIVVLMVCILAFIPLFLGLGSLYGYGLTVNLSYTIQDVVLLNAYTVLVYMQHAVLKMLWQCHIFADHDHKLLLVRDNMHFFFQSSGDGTFKFHVVMSSVSLSMLLYYCSALDRYLLAKAIG